MQFETLVCGHARKSQSSTTSPDGKVTITIEWVDAKGNKWKQTLTIDSDGIITDTQISTE